MATPDLAPIGATHPASEGAGPATSAGVTSRRRILGIIGQYAALVLLSLIVVGPLLLVLIQALSPPFQWVNAGKPLHPAFVDWKDRTWWSGGPVSVIGRTLAFAFLLAWLQKVASGRTWREVIRSPRPSELVAVVGGTVVLGFASGLVFDSLHAADGASQWWYLLAGLALSATVAWGYLDRSRRSPVSLAAQSLATGFGLIGLAVMVAGPAVWTITWSRFDLGGAMVRSLIMTVIITVAQVTTAIAAAYAFVFLRFPFKRVLFALFMATLLLPVEVTLVGNVATIRQLGWTNTMQALVLPFGAQALGTFLIRQGFRGLPSEIQDATRLDGYGHLAFLTKFAVPLTRPVVASFTVLAALTAWNQYLWPRAVIERNEFNTLQIQLRAVAAGQVADANQAIAAALVAALPVVILLIAFQRQIIRGLTAGAVK